MLRGGRQSVAALSRVAAAAAERWRGVERPALGATQHRAAAVAARAASGGLSSTSGRTARGSSRGFAAGARDEPSSGIVRLDPDASVPQPFFLVVTDADLPAGGEAGPTNRPSAGRPKARGGARRGDKGAEEAERGAAAPRLRLDTFLAARIPDVSRARLADAIQGGRDGAKNGPGKSVGRADRRKKVGEADGALASALSTPLLDVCSLDRWSAILVNDAPCAKPSRRVVPGDVVAGSLAPLPPLQVVPEDIPLNVVYEDADVAVLSKDPEMVCHPAPGHERGTLVNALLGRWGMQGWEVPGGWEGGRGSEGCERGAGESEGGEGGRRGEAGEVMAMEGGQQKEARGLLSGLGGDDGKKHDDGDDWEDEDLEGDQDDAGDQDERNMLELEAISGSRPSPTSSASDLFSPAITPDLAESWPNLVRPGIAHRLDRGTSGLLVVARTPSALVLLQRQFRRRSVERRYLAIALGDPIATVTKRAGKGELAGLARIAFIVEDVDEDEKRKAAGAGTAPTRRAGGEKEAGTAQRDAHSASPTLLVHSRIARPAGGGSRALRVPSLHSPIGVRAVSEVSLVHAFRCGATLTAWKLRTGRTHQVRVHASRVLGTPLVGDELYGGGMEACLHYFRARTAQEAPDLAPLSASLEALSRQALHAATLGFDHPRSGKYLRFAEAIPSDMSLALRRLAELGEEDWDEVRTDIERTIGEGMAGEG